MGEGRHLLERHIALFNQGVRTGDFGPMLGNFAPDATLTFEGIPVGPFHGKVAIAAAYATQPPDDEVIPLASAKQAIPSPPPTPGTATRPPPPTKWLSPHTTARSPASSSATAS
jgi:hypothetical protein